VSTPTGWTDKDGALERTFELPSFADAIAFVNRVAELAEQENHHPDIGVSYKKVTLRWTTHSAGGVTAQDYALAARSDDLAGA
jgi:4a-hydroxytetrahydrobiopterin dehydratase